MSESHAEIHDAFGQLVEHPERFPDPRPLYAQLREATPTFRSQHDFWYVTRYDLAQALFRDPTAISAQASTSIADDELHMVSTPAFDVMRETVVFHDGESHSRLRKLVNKSFTPRAVERMTAAVTQVVTEQLDVLADRSEVELVADMAAWLPTKVILDLLGIPVGGPDDIAKFRAVADAMIALNEPTFTLDAIAEADRAFVECSEIVRAEAELRRSAPRDDLLSALVTARDGDDRLTEAELVAMALFLVIAGHETTANTLATSLYHLLQQPHLVDQLRTDPEIWPTAIEELLRWDGATRNSPPKWAHRDIELEGVTIPKGEKIFIGLQAANHDPAEFVDPLTIDLRRSPNRQIVFGVGPHYCLGASLARLELRVGLSKILERFRVIELTEEIEWNPSFIIRGIRALPLRWEAV